MPATPLQRLRAYAVPFRAQTRRATSYSILNRVFDIAPPLLIGAAVDIVVEREDSILGRMGVEDPRTQVLWLALATFVVWGFESLFEYFAKVQWRNLAQAIQHRVRLDAYANVQDLEMRWFEDRPSGDVLAALNDDVNQLERFLDVGADKLIQTFTSALSISILFFVLAPSVAWISILPIPFIIWGSVWFQRKLEPRYVEVRERAADVNSALANNLAGIATIKSFTTEATEVDRISAASLQYQAANLRAIKLSAAFSPLIRVAILIGFTGTLIGGGFLTLRGEISTGAFTVMVYMTQRLLWPLTDLGEVFDVYQRAMASTARILDLVDMDTPIRSGAVPLIPGSVAGDVELCNITFAYDDGYPVLHSVDMAIPRGSTHAIVGPTGSGKTTLIKLLLRFYDPTHGAVLFDGHDLRELGLADLRRSISLVSQDVYLFAGTVADNIAYGRQDASTDYIVEAAKAAEAHDFILALPDGYQTMVGERGQKLSGGQRQRISLARAILKDAPVLVLDEATSAVDNETEAAIQRSLDRLSHSRTTIVIAHRLSTIRHADHIWVLNDGVIIEAGTHDELVATGGTYTSLWRVQTGDAVSG